MPPVLALLFGLALLAWGASRFVDGSAATARRLGVPPLLIGMTIVGFGTSAPELAIAGLSAAEGTPSLAVGNALGANVANLSFILGLAALVLPLTLNSRALRGQTALLAAATGLLVLVARDGMLTRLDAMLLLGAFGASAFWGVWRGLRLRGDVLEAESAEAFQGLMPLPKGVAWMLAGLGAMLAGSQLVVWSASQLARTFGLSELVIGLTVVAMGTTLPELATSVSASWKGEDDLVLGNVLGSNLFDTLAVIGLAAVIEPVGVPPEVLSRDLPLIGALTLGLLALSHRGGRIGRLLGLGLLMTYGAYVAALLRSAG